MPPGSGQDLTKLSLSGIYIGQAIIAILGCSRCRRVQQRDDRAHADRRCRDGDDAGGEGGRAQRAGPRRRGLGRARQHAARPADPARRAGSPPPTATQLLSLAMAPRCGLRSARSSTSALIALLSLGIATAVRDPAVADRARPRAALPVPDPRGARSRSASPAPPGADRSDDRGLAIQATTNLRGLPIHPWAGLGVLAAWAAAALVAGGLALHDATREKIAP